jgi:hypothetical protein
MPAGRCGIDQKLKRFVSFRIKARSSNPPDIYGQVENFIGTIRVFQLNFPLARMYSLVNQKVESSTGSTLIAE